MNYKNRIPFSAHPATLVHKKHMSSINTEPKIKTPSGLCIKKHNIKHKRDSNLAGYLKQRQSAVFAAFYDNLYR